jgi:hypothetical protein
VPQAGFGHHLEDALGKAKTGAEHGDDGDAGRKPLAGHRLQGRLDGHVVHGQVARGLEDHQPRDLVHERPEGAMPGGAVAKIAELVLDQRVIEDDHARTVIAGGCHGGA